MLLSSMPFWMWAMIGVIVLLQIGADRARRRREGRPVSTVAGKLSILLFVAIFVWSEHKRMTPPWQVIVVLGSAGVVLAVIAFGILALIKLAIGRK